MTSEKMPLAGTRRALELGAAFIEADLDTMRQQARKADGREGDGRVWPITNSFEADLMKVAEWASAAATLRALAAREAK